MKKSLIALAVLASTGAMAQSSVTLYGIVDVNLQSSKIDGGVRQTALESGGVSGSRFGLKGSEDLGGGLKALFVLESGFNADDGSSRTSGSLFDRQSYVGLAGNFGEVRLGNSTTALDDINLLSNSVFDSILSPTNNVWVSNGFNARPHNQIYYATPSFGGVTGAVSYALGENKATTSTGKDRGVVAFNVQYAGGPLALSLGYQSDKEIALPLIETAKYTIVNASYDLGVVKLLGSYGRAAADNYRANEFHLGADVPVGAALVVSAGYAQSQDKIAGVKDDKRSGFAVGASYSLSKRTSVYTGYDRAQTKTVAGDKIKSNIYAVGVRHAF